MKALLLGVGIGLAGGCSGPPSPAPAPAAAGPSPSCVVVPAAAAPAESLLIAAPLASDPTQLSVSTNAAVRFARAQSYETLINVDCDGRAYPGLAQSWTTDATKTRVTVVLRDGARFWSGDPVLARDVVAAWRTTGDSSTDVAPVARRLADAATIVDDRTLVVSLADTAWLVLAERGLAVSRPDGGSAWPEGSGPYRVESSTAGTITLRAVSRPSAPRLVIRSRPGADARDAIDAGADLLLSADPLAVRYAATRSDLAAVPLPWSRTYALAGPNGLAEWRIVLADSAAVFRASLARDAVRAEARAAATDGWWSATSSCGGRDSANAPRLDPTRRAVVYRDDDPVARGLAERLVAVSRRATAVSLAPADFQRALRAGTEWSYIVALPRVSVAPCRDVAALLTIAPWLGTRGLTDDVLVPLVDTRDRAILNRARVSVVIDRDGALRMITGRP